MRKNGLDPARPTPGRRSKVVCKDGEIMVGTTTGYQPGRPGFFIVPADTAANRKRCYVVASSTQEVGFV